MNLQGRNLGFGMSGDDVLLLQKELRILGFTIPSSERDQRNFGQLTQKAVRDFQQNYLLLA